MSRSISLLLLLTLASLNAAPPRRVFLRLLVTHDETGARRALDALQKGESFPSVARRLSIHSSASRGGYLGETWTDRLNEDWVKTIAGLKPGSYSEPIPFGGDFAILFLLPRHFQTKAYRLQAEGDRRMEEGKTREAAALYQEAVLEFPDFIHGYFLLGVAYRKLGDLDREIEAYTTAVEIEPKYDLGLYNLGLALIRKGRIEDGIEALQGAVRVKPDYTDALTSLSAAYLRLGRVEQAKTAARDAVLANPLRPEGYYNLGAAESRGDLKDAVADLETAVVLDAGRPEFRMALAIGQAQSNRIDEAVATLEELLRRESDYAPARELLSQIKGKTGR